MTILMWRRSPDGGGWVMTVDDAVFVLLSPENDGGFFLADAMASDLVERLGLGVRIENWSFQHLSGIYVGNLKEVA